MTPEERWEEFQSSFIPGTFKDPEIAYGFMMHVREAALAARTSLRESMGLCPYLCAICSGAGQCMKANGADPYALD